jgi:hypothetical protein
MRLLSGLASVLILCASVSVAQEARPRAGNYYDFLAAIQNSSWRGTFSSTAGLTSCDGTLSVRFFKMQVEPFSNGVPTVSYRHHAQYSPANPFFLLCQTVGKSLSVVDAGSCGGRFPTKPTTENGRNVRVPVRTIVPKNGGTHVVISAPYCIEERSADGTLHSKIVRVEYPVTQLEFADGERNTMKMQLVIDAPGLPAINAGYDLKRVGR